MKIKGKLVFDKHSGKLIGFTSLGDPDLDFSTFEELEVATHALAFMVRGVQTTLKFMFGYFLTQTVVSYQLAPLFWRAVGILELNCNLHVVVPHQVMECQPTERFIDCTSILWVKNQIFQTRLSIYLHHKDVIGSLQMYRIR